MTNNDEELSVQAIELCRVLNRKAAAACFERGISAEDVTLGGLYSCFDMATVYNGGNPTAALEWMRRGMDLLERQILAQGGTVQ